MSLHTQTISRLSNQTVQELMRAPNLSHFYLADATAMSLLYGHRYSNEIDLYTDKPFEEADLQKLKTYLHNTFGNGEHHHFAPKGNGVSFFLYNLNKDYVKVDLYYNEPRIEELETIEGFRFGGLADLMALLIEQIRIGGSKANFWDLHYLLEHHSLETLLDAHKKRYSQQHTKKELDKKLVDFTFADEEIDPRCLLKKNWNLIKLDVIDRVKTIQ